MYVYICIQYVYICMDMYVYTYGKYVYKYACMYVNTMKTISDTHLMFTTVVFLYNTCTSGKT